MYSNREKNSSGNFGRKYEMIGIIEIVQECYFRIESKGILVISISMYFL